MEGRGIPQHESDNQKNKVQQWMTYVSVRKKYVVKLLAPLGSPVPALAVASGGSGAPPIPSAAASWLATMSRSATPSPLATLIALDPPPVPSSAALAARSWLICSIPEGAHELKDVLCALQLVGGSMQGGGHLIE